MQFQPTNFHASAQTSATGTRTRVARVRAEYPNQLDYSGLTYEFQVSKQFEQCANTIDNHHTVLKSHKHMARSPGPLVDYPETALEHTGTPHMNALCAQATPSY